MVSYRFMYVAMLCVLALTVSGCRRSRDEFWDDSKSCSRHVSRGMKSLGGKGGDSRLVRSRDDFLCANDDDLGFVPLEDDMWNKELAMNTYSLKQSRFSPGDPNSEIPGIQEFEDPLSDQELASIFRNITFPFDSSLVKGEKNSATTQKIASYMKRNPNVYVFIEGHCDERGPQAYNLALGTRRANAIRQTLIDQGVEADRLFTISYGKERPLVFGQNEDAWSQNRRGQFKIYRQRSVRRG